jgi:hypothetical protein
MTALRIAMQGNQHRNRYRNRSCLSEKTDCDPDADPDDRRLSRQTF